MYFQRIPIRLQFDIKCLAAVGIMLSDEHIDQNTVEMFVSFLSVRVNLQVSMYLLNHLMSYEYLI